MKVISLSKAKELLGISGTTMDTAITAKIDYIDAIVKQITGNRFNYRVIGQLTSGSPRVSLTSINTNIYRYEVETLQEFLQVGQLISGEGIPADTYIEEVYYNLPTDDVVTDNFIPEIDMSADATEDGAGVAVYLGANIAQQMIIAKGINYLIQQTSTSVDDNTWTSKTMGPVSVTRGEMNAKIDGKYGMPSWFVRAFPKYHGAH